MTQSRFDNGGLSQVLAPRKTEQYIWILLLPLPRNDDLPKVDRFFLLETGGLSGVTGVRQETS